MRQVRESHSCQISAIFFQSCFMIETQVLMAIFWVFFYKSFPRRDLHFSLEEGGGGFRWEGFIFKWRGRPMGGASVLMGVFKKNLRMGEGLSFPCSPPLPLSPPPLWETLINARKTLLLSTSYT